jgi:hypothetical protein
MKGRRCPGRKKQPPATVGRRRLSALQQSRVREREDAFADDQVVEDADLDETEDILKSSCERLVGQTGFGDAGGVVVVVMCLSSFCGVSARIH